MPLKKQKLKHFKDFGDDTEDYVSMSKSDSENDTVRQYDLIYQAEYEVELEKINNKNHITSVRNSDCDSFNSNITVRTNNQMRRENNER